MINPFSLRVNVTTVIASGWRENLKKIGVVTKVYFYWENIGKTHLLKKLFYETRLSSEVSLRIGKGENLIPLHPNYVHLKMVTLY